MKVRLFRQALQRQASSYPLGADGGSKNDAVVTDG